MFSMLFASCNVKNSSQTTNKTDNLPPKIKIVEPIYTEVKKNNVIYSGNAVSAEYFGSMQPGVITKPNINGILKSGETFSVSSDMGYYNESKHVITLNDNIRAVLNNTYTLTCNGIDYFIEKKLIISEDPITVYSKDLQLHGDKGSIYLDKDILTINGDINAKIYNMSLK